MYDSNGGNIAHRNENTWLKYANRAAFPAVGVAEQNYLDESTKKIYQWINDSFEEISPALSLGTTAGTAAEGNHNHDDDYLAKLTPTHADAEKIVLGNGRLLSQNTFMTARQILADYYTKSWLYTKTEADTRFQPAGSYLSKLAATHANSEKIVLADGGLLAQSTFLGARAKAVDSDKLDGKDSSAFQPAGSYLSKLATNHANSEKIVLADGGLLAQTTFLGRTAKAADSDKLDGKDSSAFQAAGSYLSKLATNHANSEKIVLADGGLLAQTTFLGRTAKAADSDKLDGKDSSAFQPAGSYLSKLAATHANSEKIVLADGGLLAQSTFLGARAKAVDSDKLDGKDSSAFQPAGSYLSKLAATHANSEKIVMADGGLLAQSTFLGARAKAVDSDKLDGKDSSAFQAAGSYLSKLATNHANSEKIVLADGGLLAQSTFLGARAKAVDSDKLDGKDSSAFQPAGSYLSKLAATHANSEKLVLADGGLLAQNTFLGRTAKAADSDKLDGKDSSAFQPAGSYLTAHQSLANYYTKTQANAAFQPKGTYLTAHQSLANYYTKTEANGKFVDFANAQTITGIKTFNNSVKFNNKHYITYNSSDFMLYAGAGSKLYLGAGNRSNDAYINNTNGYLYLNNWLHFKSNKGIFSSTGAHFSVNSGSSYSPWKIQGNLRGFGGIYDAYSKVHYMHDSAGNGGFYRNVTGHGWQIYWNALNKCLSVGTGVSDSTYGLYVKKGVYTTNNGNSGQWNQAYRWGNHASAGYLKSNQSLANYYTKTYIDNNFTLKTSGGLFEWANNKEDTLQIYCAGRVNSSGGKADYWGKKRVKKVAGVISAGSNYEYQSERISTGHYRVHHYANDSFYGVIVTTSGSSNSYAWVSNRTNNYFDVYVRTDSSTIVNSSFYFIVFNLR